MIQRWFKHKFRYLFVAESKVHDIFPFLSYYIPKTCLTMYNIGSKFNYSVKSLSSF